MERLPNIEDNKLSYFYLSSNPNITWEIVEANCDKNWDYHELCSNEMGCGELLMNKVFLK